MVPNEHRIQPIRIVVPQHHCSLLAGTLDTVHHSAMAMKCNTPTGGVMQHEAEYIIVAVNLAPAFASTRQALCGSHATDYLRLIAGNMIKRHAALSTLAITVRRIDMMTDGEIADDDLVARVATERERTLEGGQ